MRNTMLMNEWCWMEPNCGKVRFVSSHSIIVLQWNAPKRVILKTIRDSTILLSHVVLFYYHRMYYLTIVVFTIHILWILYFRIVKYFTNMLK